MHLYKYVHLQILYYVGINSLAKLCELYVWNSSKVNDLFNLLQESEIDERDSVCRYIVEVPH